MRVLTILLTIFFLTNCSTRILGEDKSLFRLENATSSSNLVVHYLNIGTGSCQIVECPGSAPILFDCGSRGHSAEDMDKEQATHYIQQVLSANSTGLRVVVSHPDSDHYNYIPTVLSGIIPASIWIGGCLTGAPCKLGTNSFTAWLTTMQTNGVPIYKQFPTGFSYSGQPVPALSCGLANTYIATVNIGRSANSRSMVNLLEYNKFKILFTGDATKATQDSVIANNNGQPLPLAVLTGSHHGADTKGSNNNAWASATTPKIVVFSAGTQPRYLHPRCKSANVYTSSLLSTVLHDFQCGENRGFSSYSTPLAVYNTESVGTVVITTDGNTMSINCSRSYTSGNSCGFYQTL